MTLTPTIAGENGPLSDVAYIIDGTRFIYLSIDATGSVIYSGLAQLQTTPGNFSLASLSGNSVISIQGKQPNGISIAAIGSLSTPGDRTFSFEYVQQNTGGGTPQTTGSANGSVAITPNGRAVLTFRMVRSIRSFCISPDRIRDSPPEPTRPLRSAQSIRAVIISATRR